MNHDYRHHHDLGAPPLFAFVTATNGVRRMVQQPGIAGGAMHHDEAAGLTCTQQYWDGSEVLAVAGDLDLATLSAFRAGLKSATDATENLILDFSRLRYMDSTGIHALLDVCQKLTLAGRRMALAAVRAKKVSFNRAGSAESTPLLLPFGSLPRGKPSACCSGLSKPVVYARTAACARLRRRKRRYSGS
ncbi:MAG TPA: STAS domain-containing protein [bacterium]|nr:STAS domain-containing protein [bacterium]